MPIVSSCEVTSCFYNESRMCHAPAINVGSSHPSCDAFMDDGGRHIARKETGMVGACHISECRFNDQLTCGAAQIVVLGHSGHADCGTYQPR
jgi:hypothetical protein